MANSNNSTSLYSFTSNVVSRNDFTTLYNTTPGNIVTANVPDRNFTTLYTKQSDINPTYPYGNANVEAFLNTGSDTGGNQVQNIVMSGNLNVGSQSNLGNVGNVHITGGNLNYILQTDGSGGLNWIPLPATPSANVTLYIHFDVVSTGNNQAFTNGNLVVYANSNTMAVFKNGVNIEPSQYSISGSTLTINIPLSTGDTIDVLPSTNAGGGGSTPGGNLTAVQYNGGGVLAGNNSFTFDQANSRLNVTNINSTFIGTLGANINELVMLGNSFLGPNSNVHINGGANGQLLSTDGAGNLSWVTGAGGGTPAGSNTFVQYNNVGNFGASANFVFNSSTNTLTVPNIVGNVANANYSNFSGSATTATSANTAGSAISANIANYAVNVTGNSQPNISSLGQLYNLAVGYSGVVDFINTTNVSLGNVSNLSITGGTGGQYLTTNGNGVLSWNTVSVANSNYSNFSGNAFSVTGGNVSGIVANANYAAYAGNVTIAAQSNITSTGTLTSLTVSGTSNVANTVFNKFNETVVSGGSVSGTITPDAAAGTIYRYTLTGNITLNSLSNAVAGTSMTIELTQDGTGGRTLTSSMKFAGGSKTLSITPNAVDIISLYYNGSTYYAVLSKGYV
jgi:hypothetical protein